LQDLAQRTVQESRSLLGKAHDHIGWMRISFQHLDPIGSCYDSQLYIYAAILQQGCHRDKPASKAWFLRYFIVQAEQLDASSRNMC
jgi:hypothetical protein